MQRHEKSLRLVIGVLMVLTFGGVAPSSGQEDGLPLSHLSGTWVGKATVEAIDNCRVEQDAESAVLLTVSVSDEGAIEVKKGGVLLGAGTVSGVYRQVELRAKRVSVCDLVNGKGGRQRSYDITYWGNFSQSNQTTYLEFAGEDAPCPPSCRFYMRYRVTKQDVEVE